MSQPTLAQQVQTLRDRLNMTRRTLAERARVPEQSVEDIESGIETFLSPAIRSRLARALRVRPDVLAALEKPPPTPPASVLVQSESARISFLQHIIDHPQHPHSCPECQGPLDVRLFPRRDLRDQPITAIKVRCQRCLFQLSHG